MGKSFVKTLVFEKIKIYQCSPTRELTTHPKYASNQKICIFHYFFANKSYSVSKNKKKQLRALSLYMTYCTAHFNFQNVHKTMCTEWSNISKYTQIDNP